VSTYIFAAFDKLHYVVRNLATCPYTWECAWRYVTLLYVSLCTGVQYAVVGTREQNYTRDVFVPRANQEHVED
jgi:hypothetical protein